MSKNLRIGFTAAAVPLALTRSVRAADVVKIGVNVPQTGFAAADGKSALTGIQLAVEKANANNGINGKQIELIVYDDQASPKNSVPIATKLANKDKVAVAISGSYSSPTRAAAGVFQRSKVPYISAFAVHPDITRAGNYVFRTSFVAEVQGRAAAKLVGQDLGKKRVVITVLKNDYGKALAAGFNSVAAKYGIEVVNSYEYSIKDRQFGPIVSSIKNDNPDAIFDTGYWFVSAALVSQLRAGDVKAQIVGQEGYDGEKFIEIAKGAAEGVIITTSLDRDSADADVKAFMTAFKAKAGYAADMVGASGNTAARVAIAALRAAKSTDHEAVRNAIAAVKVDAVTGKISFNALGEVFKNVQVQIVKDGAWHRHSIIDDPELLAPPSK
ncbi:MAG: ABC transporter substrate-binding protein [Rhodospirillales bacterium]|nr:ABC transporter substrate-binding protein [Rhodospirillales bacterium]